MVFNPARLPSSLAVKAHRPLTMSDGDLSNCWADLGRSSNGSAAPEVTNTAYGLIWAAFSIPPPAIAICTSRPPHEIRHGRRLIPRRNWYVSTGLQFAGQGGVVDASCKKVRTRVFRIKSFLSQVLCLSMPGALEEVILLQDLEFGVWSNFRKVCLEDSFPSQDVKSMDALDSRDCMSSRLVSYAFSATATARSDAKSTGGWPPYGYRARASVVFVFDATGAEAGVLVTVRAVLMVAAVDC